MFSPRFPSSKLAFFALLFFAAATAAFADPTITVIAPKTGSNSGSPVFYEAYATSSCANGIAAMRIYRGPNDGVFTVNGGHLETFVYLKPGSYNTVVQAWDNCGGVAKVPVAVSVSSTALVSVFLPSGSSTSSPVHFAASAQNPDCPAGIAAMRIYTSWGFTPYTVDSNELDAFVLLKAETYYATIQAWDNCGNVFKSNFTLQSTGGDSDSHVYTNSQTGVISQFDSNNGTLSNPNGSGNPPQVQSAAGGNTIAVDPGGRFAYSAALGGVFGFQINASTGALTPAEGSPYLLSNPDLVIADPTGNFVYAIYNGLKSIASFNINRSNGELSLTADLTPGGLFTALSTDPYGEYLYAATNAGQIYGFAVNQNVGSLAPVPGSPFTIPGATYAFALSAGYQYLYAGISNGPGNQVYGYQIQYNSGTLTPVPGNPYSSSGTVFDSQSVLADWLTRYLWTANQASNSNQNYFWEFDIDGYTGAMGPATYISTGSSNASYMAEGYGGQVVYTAGSSCGPVTCVPGTADSWTINGSGALEHLSGPLNLGTNNPTGIAVARKTPE
ncbi:MAG: beta-propeller fold lactonase family protein [Terriglobales bacterium]